MDEYVIVNLEDEFDNDNLPIIKDEEDDALTEQLIRTFSPHTMKNCSIKSNKCLRNQDFHPEGSIIPEIKSTTPPIKNLPRVADQKLGPLLQEHPND